MGVANDCCGGRVVSVLEGGYSVDVRRDECASRRPRRGCRSDYATKLATPDKDAPTVVPRSALCRSVRAHVEALMAK